VGKPKVPRILVALVPMLIVGGLVLGCRAFYETAMFGWSVLWPIYVKLVRWVGIKPATAGADK
jgi:hypothetical protein